MKKAFLKPYLKCSLKYDWHTPTDDVSINVLQCLVKLLVEKGFRRKSRIRKWYPHKKVLGEDVKATREKGFPLQSLTDSQSSNCTPIIAMSGIDEQVVHKFASLGLRSVLRGMDRGYFSIVFLDSEVIAPSAVATSLALYASNCSETKVYSLKTMSEMLAKELNMVSVNAVGIFNGEAPNELLTLVESLLIPVERIDLVKKKKTLFHPVEAFTPIGKKGKHCRRKKKKKKDVMSMR